MWLATASMCQLGIAAAFYESLGTAMHRKDRKATVLAKAHGPTQALSATTGDAMSSEAAHATAMSGRRQSQPELIS
jgi:hypothetical protein